MIGKKKLIEIRRDKVLELNAKEHNELEIARELGVSQQTVSLDIKHIIEKSRENNRKHYEERMPFEYRKCGILLGHVIRKMVDITDKENADPKDIAHASTVLLRAIELKLGTLDSEGDIEEVTRFVIEQKSRFVIEQRKSKSLPQGLTDQNDKVVTDNVRKDT